MLGCNAELERIESTAREAGPTGRHCGDGGRACAAAARTARCGTAPRSQAALLQAVTGLRTQPHYPFRVRDLPDRVLQAASPSSILGAGTL